MMWPTTTASCRLYFPPNSNRSGSSDLMDSTNSYITMRRQFIMQDVNLYFSFGRPEEGNKLVHSFGETNNNNNNNNRNNNNIRLRFPACMQKYLQQGGVVTNMYRI